MILVTGATGHVGSELVRLLAEQGAPARALVHSPDKAAPIQRLGLETALGDYEQPDTLDVAMKGCDQLFLLSPPTPRQPQQERHVIEAARRAGVGHVVKQSVPWAGADAPVVFSRWHGQIEEDLAQSGLAYTLLRPSSFMQNFLMSAQQVADQGVLYGMFGEGRVAFIDARDVAAVAAELLTSPGHQIRSVDLGPDGYRQALAGAGMPGWLVDGVVEGNTMLAAGHGATVTDEVARLTGRPPRTFAQFAADHRVAFGGQPS